MSLQSESVHALSPAGGKKSLFWAGRKMRDRLSTTIAFVVMVTLGLFYAFPFYWTMNTALKTDKQVYIFPPTIYPPTPQWINFKTATEYIPYWLYLRNTFVICFFAILGIVLSCTLIAYGFSRIKFKGREVLFIIYLSTLMLPGQVTMIPLYVFYQKLGWVGSILPLVVPAYFGNVAYVFMLRQFFRTIPNELSDAAFIDGATDMQILFRIMLPLCRPALATIALLTFIGSYQDFLGPLIYLTDQAQWTIAIGLNMFKNSNYQQWQLMMSASALSMAPMLILYFFTQRTLIQGIALTGIKG